MAKPLKIKSFSGLFKDFCINYLSIPLRKKNYTFAFLVHARDLKDIYRKYPFLKVLPNTTVQFIAKHMWPIVVSEVTGLKSLKSGKEVKGLVIGIIITAEQMMDDKKYALKKIIQMARFAKKMGVSIVGLGGLTASLSRGGQDIIDHVNINVTTGHAYTAYTIMGHTLLALETFNLPANTMKVAIVGASGSVGTTTAMLLARKGIKNLILIEIPRKKDRLLQQVKTIQKSFPHANLQISTDMEVLKNADVIITATNAVEAVIYNKYLKKGAIIIDDAQPSDVADEVLDNPDVLVLEAGAVTTPGVDSHFNFGLAGKEDNFCCMCEIMILAANEWKGHYVVSRATLQNVDKIADMSEGLNFYPARMQNSRGHISTDKIERIKKSLTKLR